MKKRILLLTAIAGMGYVILSSNAGGPTTGSAGNRTGAKGSTANCSTGGCHGSGTGTTVAVSVMTGTTTVTQYVPGTAYTVKIHGTHATHTKFGFQFVGVSGTGSSQVNAGTASGLPSGVANRTASGLTITEHTSTRTGSSASALDVQFTWTAPATSVGAIYMYCTLNAVDGSTSDNSADVAANTVYTLTPSTLAVTEVAASFTVSAFPNPVMNTLHLQTEQPGKYNVNVYDLNGRNIASEQMDINGVGSINAGNWAVGLYHLVIQKDDKMQVIPVVKQ